MLDELAILFGLLVLALLVGLIVLPIVALIRTRQIGDLSRRVHRLEKELRRLRDEERPAAVPSSEERHELAEAATSAREEIPLVVAVEPKTARPALDLEALVGGRGLGWAAVVLLLFAVAFFLKLVFERGLIGELGRVAIGLVAGMILTGAGLHFHRRGWRIFSQMLTAGGIAVLYLATFASFGFYHLLPSSRAAYFLVILVAEAFTLAVLYEAPAIALMAVIGGLLTPLLLHTDRDQYQNLFTYMAVLDAGVVGLTFFRRWIAVSTVALAGTQSIFWAWYFEHYHPDKLAACLIFQAVVFTLFVAQTLVSHGCRRRAADVEDLGRVMLNAFLLAAAGYALLDPDYHRWLGSMAVGMAAAYALLAYLMLMANPQDQRLLLALVATAMAFLAAVFPLQAEAAWIALGWAVQGLALWAFGWRVRAPALRVLGFSLFVLATGRLVFVDTLASPPHNIPFVPLFNTYGLPATLVAVCLVLAAMLSRRFELDSGTPDYIGMRGLGLGGVVLLWGIFSIEAYDYFVVRADRQNAVTLLGKQIEGMDHRQLEAHLAEEQEHGRRSAQTALSVLWAAFAAAVLAVGFRLPSRPLRWAALGLFGLTGLKVLMIDMGNLPGLYRVLAFLVLSIMMGAAAWAYQKLRTIVRLET